MGTSWAAEPTSLPSCSVAHNHVQEAASAAEVCVLGVTGVQLPPAPGPRTRMALTASHVLGVRGRVSQTPELSLVLSARGSVT